MFDLEPATTAMSRLLAEVRDDQLSVATPCPEYVLGDLLDHVNGLSLAFTWAATKDERAFGGGDVDPSGDASRLGDDWRAQIPARLDALAEAWRDPAAWEGMTQAGGVDLPGEVAAVVALNEVIVHGWDVARSTGQPFEPDEQLLQVCLAFVTEAAKEPSEGPFGPPVDVPADAPLLDRVVGLSGRIPAWPAS